MDSPHQLSASAKKALDGITGEIIKPAATAQEIKPMSLDDYKALCTEMLPDLGTALSDKVSQQYLDYIEQDPHLKQHFAPGYTYCAAVMPCGTYGAPLQDEDVKKGAHIRILMVDQQSGQTVAGFSQGATHMFNVLPAEIQATAFTIPPYANNQPYNVTPQDRSTVAELYKKSFEAVRKLLI